MTAIESLHTEHGFSTQAAATPYVCRKELCLLSTT